MDDYIDKILVPYLQEKAAGVPCLLFLDQFSAHWTATVQDKLVQIGITPYQIPAGCTSLLQPIDVGIGKPFKDRVWLKWWDWMLDQGADRSTFANVTCELASKWVADSWDELMAEIAENAWKKTGFKYFED